MATLLILKAEVEDRIGSRMRMVFSGAAEAHLIAEELGMPRQLLYPSTKLSNKRNGGSWGDFESCQAISFYLGSAQDVGAMDNQPVSKFDP
jgi:hypothetical protein